MAIVSRKILSELNNPDLLNRRARYRFDKAVHIEEYNYQEIAGMIDHALLHPTLTDEELASGCSLAHLYEVATVCVKPYHVGQAVKRLEASSVKVCTVIGFPHGANLSEVKKLETQRACEQGAREVDMVINLGKARTGDWEYIEEEISQVCETARQGNAKTKVIFENDYWNSCEPDSDGDSIKKKLCKICETVGANWVKTSTGFGYVAQADGSMATMGATEHDIALMAGNCSNKVEIKAAGGIKNFTTLLKMKDLGVSRIGTSSTRLILEECRESLNLDPLGQNIFKTTQGY